jgi:hypothetical protein
MNTPTISINDVGPVTEFEYQLSEPGLHVLRGRQQAGKTTILRTVQLATDGRSDEKPTKRDGTKGGKAVVAGKTLKISRAIREEGDLSVDGLGDLDISVLHRPKFKDAPTRDKYRIATLCRLAGVKATAALFHDVVGGEEAFKSIVDKTATETDDIVEMAARVKRCIDKAALETERKAEKARADLRAKSDQFSGVNLKAECDAKTLEAAQVAAIEEKSRITQQRTDALQAQREAAEARQKLEESASGVSLADATAAVGAATDARCAAESAVDDLERKLTSARHALELAEAAETAATEALSEVQNRETVLSRWRAQIDAASGVHCPTELEVAQAASAVDAANAAVALGMKVREAITAKAAADAFAAEAKLYEKEAERLRKAATATYDVLTEAIEGLPNCPMKVWVDEDGYTRLVLPTKRSDKELFDELSDGAIWTVIVPMLCNKPGRLVVLPQAAYGEIQPANRDLIHKLFKERECYLLTAEVDDGDLRAEMYTSNGRAA